MSDASLTSAQAALLDKILTERGERSARENWKAFRFTSPELRDDLRELLQRNLVYVDDNAARLSLLGLALLGRDRRNSAGAIYGDVAAVMYALQLLSRRIPLRPGQKFTVDMICSEFPTASPDKKGIVQEALRYLNDVPSLFASSEGSVNALEAIEPGEGLIEYGSLGDAIEGMLAIRQRSLSSMTHGAAPRRQKESTHKILDERDALLQDLTLPRGAQGRAVLFIDIDDFKRFNARFGHTDVDEFILKPFQRLLLDLVGQLGGVYRFAGDEFTILLQNASEEVALAVAETIRQRVEGMQFDGVAIKERLTVTIGVAHAPNVDQDAELQARANEAEYQAKNKRKNRVVVWSENGYQEVERLNRSAIEPWVRESLAAPEAFHKNEFVRAQVIG